MSGNVVAVNGSPGWTGGQFVYASGTQPNTYFVFIASGALEGRSFPVLGNGTNSLTVDPGSGNLSGIAPGDALRLVPYWTLGTLFPAASAGASFTPTSDPSSPQTTVSLFVSSTAGINAAPGGTFFFYSGAWRQTSQSLSLNRNDQVIPLHAPLRIRNASTGGVLITSGAVVTQKLAVSLVTQVSGPQDNFVALARPLPVTLNDSGLIASGAFQASASALSRSDLVMVTDNGAGGLNPAPSAYYIYYNAGWRKLGQPLTADFGADVIFDVSKSVAIRLAPSSDGAARVWVNPATY